MFATGLAGLGASAGVAVRPDLRRTALHATDRSESGEGRIGRRVRRSGSVRACSSERGRFEGRPFCFVRLCEKRSLVRVTPRMRKRTEGRSPLVGPGRTARTSPWRPESILELDRRRAVRSTRRKALEPGSTVAGGLLDRFLLRLVVLVDLAARRDVVSDFVGVDLPRLGMLVATRSVDRRSEARVERRDPSL